MKNLLSSLTVVIMAVLVAFYISTGKIALFIHPRYFELTRLMSIVALFFGILGILFSITKYSGFNRKEIFSDYEKFSGIIVITFFVVLGFIYPLKPLSSATLDQRSNEINFIQTKSVNIDKFSTNTKEYDISEWVYILQTDPNWEKLVGKEVELEGFIYEDSRLPDDHFLVAKFIISCCAVDARPVGIPVSYEWRGEFKTDQWVRIEGALQLEEYNSTENIVILPDRIEAINIPEDPYIY